MKTIIQVASLILALWLAACGESSTTDTPGGSIAGNAPADAPGVTNNVPALPASGSSRAGMTYNVYITAPGTGDKVAFTVFEPALLEGGKSYPLVLHSHGFSSSRQTSTPQNLVSGQLSRGNIDALIAAGYGAISIDQRGHGETGGTIRVMDPDAEGKDLLAVLDWAEAKLGWLAYGPSADGSDPRNLVLGSVGGSYGGMYQYLIHNVDPKHRLDAMVPQIAPNDLTYGLFPNQVIKAGWDVVLFGAGNTAGSNLDRGHFDPFVLDFFETGLSTGVVSPEGHDFFYYHSSQYFCGSDTVATNGGAGTTPERAPGKPAHGKVNVMIFQGFRDTLFPFNNAYQNYQCYAAQGGDVRLLSYQAGHNALQVVPDVGNHLFQPVGNELDGNCGNINVDTATKAFFDEYLKGMKGETNKVVPTKPCLSLTMGDGVLVDQVTVGRAGTVYDIPSTTVLAGLLDVPMTADLGITVGADGNVIGGIPHIVAEVASASPVEVPGADPIIFVGVGHQRATVPGVWDLIDNQITPLRGLGSFDVDLTGVAERLLPGDKLALLIYGGHDQYHVTGSINLGSPTVLPVTVTGKVWLPLLGNLPNMQP